MSSHSYIQKSQTLSTLSGSSVLKDDEVTSSEEVTQGKEQPIKEDTKKNLELPLISEQFRNCNKQIELPCLSLFPVENIYESAAKLLFLCIKWTRSVPSFLQVIKNALIIKL